MTQVTRENETQGTGHLVDGYGRGHSMPSTCPCITLADGLSATDTNQLGSPS